MLQKEQGTDNMNLKRCLCLMVRLFLPHAILGIHLFLCHDHVADRSVTIAGLFLGYDQIFIQSEISRADIDLFASLETLACPHLATWTDQIHHRG